MAAISSIRNLGPAMEKSLTNVGIASAEALHDIGAHEAYRLLLTHGERPHFIGYYVLHMALQGRPWNDCKGTEKANLRIDFDALVKETAQSTPVGIESILDAIGTGTTRQ